MQEPERYMRGKLDVGRGVFEKEYEDGISFFAEGGTGRIVTLEKYDIVV